MQYQYLMFSTISIIGVRLADPAPASETVGTRTLRLALGWLLRQQLRQLRRRKNLIATCKARACLRAHSRSSLVCLK